MAQNLIASKRLELEDALTKVSGVQFFISSVTAVATNAKRASAEDEELLEDFYPAVAFFIVFRETDLCTATKIYTLLHNEETDATVQPIITRANGNSNVMETASRQLFSVVKDHNSQPIMDMLQTSNDYCLANCQRTTSAEDSEENAHPSRCRPRYPTCPCRVVVVNCPEFDAPLQEATMKLRADGMKIDIESRLTALIDGAVLSSTTDELSATIAKIGQLMKISNHALHRGDVYAKPTDATTAYLRMMDVGSYINKLLVNEVLRAKILKHMTTLIKILSHPACEIIKQIEFDFNLIEVSNGYFFKISSRSFVRDAIPLEKYGIISPRTFMPYDCTKDPEAAFFEQGVQNSFPDDIVRANFCNKFYQCLMASKMPHKVRKLVVEGPKDSGKTSWASIFHRVIPQGKIASITGEGQFSAAMITEDTQLVVVDEWSESTLQSDLAKTIFQGGWMVTAVKHGLPRTVMNNSPFYITTNEVPNFGEDDENVKRRIVVFNTTSLPTTTPGADRWMFTNAMHCIAWLANEINTFRRHVDPEELWYEETRDNEERTIGNNEGAKQFDVAAIERVTSEDLMQSENADIQSTVSRGVIHSTFEVEFTRQRLGRKRAKRTSSCTLSRPPLQSQEEEEEPPIVDSDDFERSGESSQLSDGTQSSVDNNQSCKRRKLCCKRQKKRRQPKPIKFTSKLLHLLEDPESNLSTNSNDKTQDCIESTRNPCPTNTAVLHQPESTTHAPTVDTAVGTVDKQMHESDDEQQENSLPLIIPDQSTWVLNDNWYYQKIVNLWEWNFHRTNLSRYHAISFTERRMKAERRRDKTEADFWTKADPEIDAWMLVTGKTREVFDIDRFAKRHEKDYKTLLRVRAVVHVKIMKDRCPMFRAMEKINNPNKECEDVVLNSQTYFTTIRQ